MRYSKRQQKRKGGGSKQKSVYLGFHLPVETKHQQTRTFVNFSRVTSGMFDKILINRVINQCTLLVSFNTNSCQRFSV